MPRVTIRAITPFEGLAGKTRLRLDIETADPAVPLALAAMVESERGGRGELRLLARTPDGGVASILLGRDFMLDAELVARIERIPGVERVQLGSIDLGAAGRPKLAAVS